MKFLKKCILTMAAVAALSLGTTGATFANDNVNARIEALEAALKELRAEVVARDEKIAAMEVKTAEIDKMPVFSDTKLEMESRDGKFAMGISGRIQADAYAIDDDDSTVNPMGNGMEFRRVRLAVAGKMFGDWRYKLEADYAGNAISIADAYIETDLAEGLGIRAGHFKEYYGLENLSSDNYNTFMEASLAQRIEGVDEPCL